MTSRPGTAAVRRSPLPAGGQKLLDAFTASALAQDSPVTPNEDFDAWFARQRRRPGFTVRRVPVEELGQWEFAPDTGDLRHSSGRFFTVQGLRVESVPDAGEEPAGGWEQPIMSQREIGVLGFLVAQFDGVPHFLVQAKMEPGNVRTVHLAPSLQATRSNLAGVHQGRGTPLMEHFRIPGSGRVLVDSLQSERGAWFLRKRNRHLVVEAVGDLELTDDYRWLTLGQLHRLLSRPNHLTMEACSLLALLPLRMLPDRAGSPYGAALLNSQSPSAPTVQSTVGVVGRLNEVKARHQVRQHGVPLGSLTEWHRDGGVVRRPDGRFFEVVGLEVTAPNREVAHWTQPLFAPVPGGVAALMTRVFDGVLHVLLHARVEAGLIDVAELCPTVQCTPSNYRGLPAGQRPRYLDEVLAAPASAIRFDAVLSEEGARFHRAESRYLVIEAPDDFDPCPPDGFVWVSVAQVHELLRHSYLLNMQARTLVAALQSLY
ncbi:NDP-hexose 2,3-dehydratase family protein [Streptomyces sp. NPDC048417]|uniref:NDP-hexose 2,3-dehydratase family protein n=1 Tax=Streptomyces sp. NPDC048417 TaxID=3155387 RepID=UPI0034156071